MAPIILLVLLAISGVHAADGTYYCWAYGDPHFKTFEGKRYNYMSSGSQNLMLKAGSFSVYAKHYKYGRVSSTSAIRIQRYGKDIGTLECPTTSCKFKALKDSVTVKDISKTYSKEVNTRKLAFGPEYMVTVKGLDEFTLFVKRINPCRRRRRWRRRRPVRRRRWRRRRWRPRRRWRRRRWRRRRPARRRRRWRRRRWRGRRALTTAVTGGRRALTGRRDLRRNLAWCSKGWLRVGIRWKGNVKKVTKGLCRFQPGTAKDPEVPTCPRVNLCCKKYHAISGIAKTCAEDAAWDCCETDGARITCCDKFEDHCGAENTSKRCTQGQKCEHESGECVKLNPPPGDLSDDTNVVDDLKGWTHSTITTCGSFGSILGGHGGLGAGSELQKWWTIPCKQADIYLSFKFVRIGHWFNKGAWLLLNNRVVWEKRGDLANGKTGECGDGTVEEWKVQIEPAIVTENKQINLRFGTTLVTPASKTSWGIKDLNIEASCFKPTFAPTVAPTSVEPTKDPSFDPTSRPTDAPSDEPTLEPTNKPSFEPTKEPTRKPSPQPTFEPTSEPTIPLQCRECAKAMDDLTCPSRAVLKNPPKESATAATSTFTEDEEGEVAVAAAAQLTKTTTPILDNKVVNIVAVGMILVMSGVGIYSLYNRRKLWSEQHVYILANGDDEYQ